MATCTVSGTFLNPQGSAVSGATVRFNIESPVLDATGRLLMPKEITTTTAVDGTWSLDILQSIAGNLSLEINPTSLSPLVRYCFSMVIPATGTATFASCWADSPNFGGQSTSSPLMFSDIGGVLATDQLPPLPATDIWVGDALGLAAPVAMSGDATLSSSGAVTVGTVGGSTAALIHSAELLANTATSANTASAVVQRDGSGNFAAGTITASLSGNATTATSATSFSGSLGGDVQGLQASTQVTGIRGYTVASTTPTDAQVQVYSTATLRYNPVSFSGDVTVIASGAATVASVGGSTAALVHSAELLANAAASANTLSAIVKRDGSGNFAAGTITATLSGSATSFSGNLVGDVTGTQGATVVGAVAGSTAANVHAAELLANAATDANTLSAIVKRDGSGNFSAGTITANLTGNASGTAATITGISTVAHGGTGLATLTDKSVIIGAGTSNVTFVAPGTLGNLLTSDGTNWASTAPAASGSVGPLTNIMSFYRFS